MIDIHSHILFSVDDGARSIEESISILKDLKRAGYSSIILTPHYIKNSKYDSNREHNLKRLEVLKDEVKKNNLDINLYLGNEIYIDDDIISLLRDEEITSLNDSKYLLIELPMSGEYENYEDIFTDLIYRGYKVILAHPERYFAFQKDFNRVYELERIGVLFQSNIDSIIGGYGSNAKKMVKRLLKEHKLSFLATDAHRRKNPDNFLKAHKRALRYIDDEYYQELVEGNASKLLETKVMETI